MEDYDWIDWDAPYLSQLYFKGRTGMTFYVKLIPRTAKASKKLKEAKGPNSWIVVDTKESVAFSDKPGPWHRIKPDGNTEIDCTRWVNEKNDTDFIVEFV